MAGQVELRENLTPSTNFPTRELDGLASMGFHGSGTSKSTWRSARPQLNESNGSEKNQNRLQGKAVFFLEVDETPRNAQA
jgi:hypothetical protein